MIRAVLICWLAVGIQGISEDPPPGLEDLGDVSHHRDWTQFKLLHERSYDSLEEERMRKDIFLKNKRMIEEHNKKYEEGLVTFKMAMNHFGDLTDEEYANLVLSPNLTMPQLDGVPLHNMSASSEDSLGRGEYVNWYDRGAVTPIKNQGGCGSCWAFSVAGALESHHKIKYGQLIPLSEQNLLDCSSNQKYKNQGCLGGWMAQTFQYVMDNGGVDMEMTYPYQGSVGPCRFNPAAVGATCAGYVQVPSRDENALKDAIARVGPVSVAIDALRPTFKFYGGGIYFDLFCGSSPNPLNHAVLAIGYGEQLWNAYWIVKNSWGTGWGERGFFRLARNKMNHCGIATAAVYPIV